MLESLAAWIAILVFPLEVTGFVFLIIQTRQAKFESSKASTAAERARNESARAAAFLARNMLLLLLPKLQQTEKSLQRAIRSEDLDQTVEYLSEWRSHAGQLIEHLKRRPVVDEQLISHVRESIEEAGMALLNELDTGDESITTYTKRAQMSITKVTGRAGELLAEAVSFSQGTLRRPAMQTLETEPDDELTAEEIS